ncbi:MAG: CRISPR system precrRNA processing endoribonuclease RAMP protein Cas6 [Fibromonadaceae bacterium]|jgi:CRISPR-associated endoribonuclease Cas6|nr:CRISPR system precrRNA processing endoribonuclease RAMP protein Cas6 [Fibromonadaceae bacterium]
MQIQYTTLTIPITLTKKAAFSQPVPFIFRSILGFNLRKLVCVAKSAECKNCLYKESCVYSLAFDEAEIHPTILTAEPFFNEKTLIENVELSIIFLGKFAKYADYYLQALKRGAKSGILRERIPYKIEIEQCKIENGNWNVELCSSNFVSQPQTFKFELLTPFRFKAMGKYNLQFTELDFILCLHRRCQKLCSLYGKNNFKDKYFFENKWKIIERDLKWQKLERWSSRQKQVMPLGGIIGDLTLQGEFTEYELALFQFARLFNVGKNTNFGMGNLNIQKPPLSCYSIAFMESNLEK